jgi:enamine deaminase RidA (YjgF/YER057c/UK114 family)
MGVQLPNVEGLLEPPGSSHVAVASGVHLVFTAGAVPLDGSGELVEIEPIAVVADDPRL